MTMATVNRAPRPSGLADVLDVVLDKGIVIDAYVRVSLVGIELLTIDARIVIASVDTYLRFAEAVNRLDLQPSEQVAGLPGLMDNMREGGARKKTKGALTGAKESFKETFGIGAGRRRGRGRRARGAAGRAPAGPLRAGLPARTGAALMVLLVHGIVRAEDADLEDVRVPEGLRPRTVVAATGWPRSCPRRPDRELTAEDAAPHLDLLVALARRRRPVLPVPFGTTAPDDDAVREEVLTPAADQLEQQLDAIADLVEVRLDLTFDTDALGRRRPRPAIPGMRGVAERAAAPGAGFSERMALGEAMAARVADTEAALVEEWTAELESSPSASVVLLSDEQSGAPPSACAGTGSPTPTPPWSAMQERPGGPGRRRVRRPVARLQLPRRLAEGARSPRRPRVGVVTARTAGQSDGGRHETGTRRDARTPQEECSDREPSQPVDAETSERALGGYVLGRFKKGRAAIGLAMWAAGVKADPKG